MELFNGNKHAKVLEQQIVEHLKTVENLKKLVIIMVGEDEASKKYIRLKEKFCKKVGVPFELRTFSENISDIDILNRTKEIVNSDSVGGVIIQLPLPRDSLRQLLNIIPVDKDIDVLSKTSRERYFDMDFTIMPPVVRATKYFIDTNGVDIKNQKCIVLGSGFLVGQPISCYLKSLGGFVTELDVGNYKKTLYLEAKLIVLATGEGLILDGGQLSPNTNVIDFSFPSDLNMSSKLDHLALVSPSPGGMGPLVVRYLVMNHLGI